MRVCNCFAVLLVVGSCHWVLATQKVDSPNAEYGLPVVEQLLEMEPLAREVIERIRRPKVAPPGPSCTTLLDGHATGVCAACLEAASIPEQQEQLRQRLQNDPGSCRQILGCLERYRPPPALLSVLPTKPDVVAKVENVYFFHLGWQSANENQFSAFEEWLRAAESNFAVRLLEEAQEVRIKNYWIKGEQHLLALARVDWESASPIVARLVTSDKPRLRALGVHIEVTARPDLEPDRRSQLLAAARLIAEDTAAPGDARSNAFDALLLTEWPDRKSWYIAQFSNAGLSRVKDGPLFIAPLCQAVERDPEQWIPELTRLVASDNHAEHDNATHCLVQFNQENARADALRPLLPWLTDPGWASKGSSAPNKRARLIQSLELVDLPESVPGLIWVAEHETRYELAGAAAALAKYGATAAVPALRGALLREPTDCFRRAVIKALLALGGLSRSDRADGVVALLRLRAAPGGSEMLMEWIGGFGDYQPPEVSIGIAVTLGLGVDEEVAAILHGKMVELEGQEPAVADWLERVLTSWSFQSVDAAMLDRLEAGNLTARGLSNLLTRAESVRSTSLARLQGMVNDGGAKAGIAAVFLDNQETLTRLLEVGDPRAVRAVLVCARHLRADLPLEPVARLLGSDQYGPIAALYLEALDTAEARELLLTGGSPRIVGSRPGNDPGHHTYRRFDNYEDELSDLIASADGPDEVIALLSAGYRGDHGQRWILISDGKAEMLLRFNPQVIRQRPLGADELDRVRRFLDQQGVDKLPPYTPRVRNGMQYEYVHLTGDRGVRVFMNNPEIDPDGDVYGRLAALFFELERTGTFSSRYALVDSVPGAEVLYDGAEWVFTVCGDEEGVAAEVGSSRFSSWRRVDDTGLGDEVAPPGPCADHPTSPFGPPEMEFEADCKRQPPYVRSCPSGVVVQAIWNQLNGLWLSEKGGVPTLIAEGEFEFPVITTDCRFVVAIDTDSEHRALVLFDLEEKARRKLDLATDFKPVMVMPDSGQVLLDCRRRECGDLLLDPLTAGTQPAPTSNDGAPVQPQRAFQSAGAPHLVWSTRVNRDEGNTEIGIFSMKDFSFEPRHSLPFIALEPHQVWIDADRGWLFLATGDLLRLPWPPPPE